MRQHTKRNRVTTFDFVVWIGLFIIGFLFIYYLLSRTDVSNFTVEILAVTIGVVLVVVSVGVTIHIQTQYELEREFQVKIYETKIKLYGELLSEIAVSDDDRKIDDNELEKIRNLARNISLLADENVLVNVACFVWILEKTEESARTIAIDNIADVTKHRSQFVSQLPKTYISDLAKEDGWIGKKWWELSWMRGSRSNRSSVNNPLGTVRRIVAAMRQDLQVSLGDDTSSDGMETIVKILVDKEEPDKQSPQGKTLD